MIHKILDLNSKPELYEQGNAVMWTDEYISKQLLAVHLSEHTDLASRKPETINKTIHWILSSSGNKNLNILDLGCGPGLYSEKLASRGHHVTGVDFSANSIDYAKASASRNGLEIEYICQDYTNLDLPENKYDLVMLIYTDFGPLLPAERERLLRTVKRVLRPGGLFVFDFLNDSNVQRMLTPQTWDATNSGFWKEAPYLALSSSFHYEREKVVLFQHMILDEEESLKLYRFWHHFFSQEDIEKTLQKYGFSNIQFYENVIPGGDGYQEGDVTFCSSVKT